MALLILSDDESKAAMLYMRRCLQLLRLHDWDILLQDEAGDDGNHAEVNAHESGRYIVNLYLPNNWAEKPTDVKRATLMHEAFHVMHAHVERAVRHLEDQSALSEDVFDLVFERFRDATEYMVDKLTSVIADLDALPPWPTPKQVATASMDHTRKGGTL